MKHLRRLLVLFLSLTLVLPVLTGAALADYTETNSYALNYNSIYDGAKWQYFSPYVPAYKYDNGAGTTEAISFSLYNTVTGECIPTYCTDIDTGLAKGSNFRRINLEDSTYAASAAGVLRSIMLKGFPNVSVEALGKAAGVENLTVGEAVTATQTAIWQTAHGNLVDFPDFCDYIDPAWNPTHTAHYDECNEEIENGYAADKNEALIESHISAVFGYLISLPSTPPSGKAVSNSSFTEWSAPEASINKDGTTYNISVNAKTYIGGTKADVELTAYLAADSSYSARVTLRLGSNDNTLTIQNVPAELANSEVILAIDGTQTVSDVFLFDAVGDRGTSQSLIGIDDSNLPVHADVIAQPERKVNIHKTSDDRPLEGIHFDFYKVANLDDYLTGKTVLPDAKSYRYYGQADYTIVTDSNGEGTFSLTKNDMPDGVYLVVEKEHDAIVAPVDPFYIILPATNANGTGYEYTVNVFPKNKVKAQIDITKDVIELGKDLGNVDAYAPHTWIISATIPSDIAAAKRYEISDTLDNRLDFLGNVVVTVESLDGTEKRVELVSGTDYTLTVTDNDSLAEGKPSDSFAIALKGAGMVKVSNAIKDDTDMIRVYFDAQINANGVPGEEIPNQAHIEYINSVNVDFSDDSDIPEVYTGAVEILKIDGADKTKTLAGATFELYRAATETEIANNDIEKVTLEGLDTPMVKVSFSPSAAFTSDKVTSATSDDDGKVYFYGLTDGEYYAVETKAPAGYNLLQKPIKLLVGIYEEGTETAEGEAVVEHPINVYPVENRAGAVLPETGGMGTTVLYVGGSLLVLLAFVCLTAKRKAC